MSRKTDGPREKKSSLLDLSRKERPKTAIRKLGPMALPRRPRSAVVTPIPSNQLAPLPPRQMFTPKGRKLASISSLDSGLGPHNSSPDLSTDEEGESEESGGHETSEEEEEEEEESVDSGIIKVKVSVHGDNETDESGDEKNSNDLELENTKEGPNREGIIESGFNHLDKTDSEVQPSNFKVGTDGEKRQLILVKEFEINEKNTDGDNEVPEEEIDEDVDARNGEVVYSGHQNFPLLCNDMNHEDGTTNTSKDLVLTDIEPHERLGILGSRRRDTEVEKDDNDVDERPSYEKKMEEVLGKLELEESKTYEMAAYKVVTERAGEDRLKSKKELENKHYDITEYESVSRQQDEEETKEKQEDADRLNDSELEELKKKCLSRVVKQQNTPMVNNPPVIKDFSNSQKLLNFLDQTEEKDRNTINTVKRSGFTAQVVPTV